MTARLRWAPKEAAAHLAEADAKLAPIISRVGPPRIAIEPRVTLFDALARAIVYQQLSGKAAQTIHERFLRAAGSPLSSAAWGARGFGAGGTDPKRVLRLSDETLRRVGLSRGKQAAIRDLAERAVTRRLPTLEQLSELEDDAVVDALTEVRGVGPWTVHMLLIFRLGRPDVLPTTDFGVRKGFATVHRKRALPTPKALERHAEKWRPFRSAASWYLWRALDLASAAR